MFNALHYERERLEYSSGVYDIVNLKIERKESMFQDIQSSIISEGKAPLAISAGVVVKVILSDPAEVEFCRCRLMLLPVVSSEIIDIACCEGAC
jgi:hypothetical protein